MYAYEVATEEPYLFPLATTKFPTASQAFSFLPKYLCNVKEVEFAKAYRLTQTSVEPVSFTVPRVRVRLHFINNSLKTFQLNDVLYILL